MSTVTIDLLTVIGAAISCQVMFKPLDTPLVSGPALTVSRQRSVQTSSDGTASVTLAPGRYAVAVYELCGKVDTLYITVPNDHNTYSLTALLWTGGNVVAQIAPVNVASAPVLSINASQASVFRCLLATDAMLNAPSNGGDGQYVQLWVTAAGGDVALTLAPGIAVPTGISLDSASPLAIPAGRKLKLTLSYDAVLNGGQWEVSGFLLTR